MEIKFCKICKKKLPLTIFGFGVGERVYEFEDGSYCEICARLIVNKRRKK